MVVLFSIQRGSTFRPRRSRSIQVSLVNQSTFLCMYVCTCVCILLILTCMYSGGGGGMIFDPLRMGGRSRLRFGDHSVCVCVCVCVWGVCVGVGVGVCC